MSFKITKFKNNIMSYGFKIKTENNSFKTIVNGFDYCEILEKLNLELNSCYYNWEILKEWKMK